MIEDSPNMEETQNLMVQYDGITRILDILSKSSIPNQIYSSFLSLLITTLEGGNKLVQKTIYNYFTNYPQSEQIFQKFDKIM